MLEVCYEEKVDGIISFLLEFALPTIICIVTTVQRNFLRHDLN